MSAVGIDPVTGDLPIGCIPYVSGKDALCQRIQCELCLVKGESCFFPSAGIDRFSPIYRNRSNIDLIIANYRAAILNIPTIRRIISFETEFEGTAATYKIAVQCDDGEIINTGGLIDGF